MNAIFVPLFLMIVITAVLVWQITYLLRDSAKVERADRVIARANYLQKLTIDLETGLRGFLVTGDDQFLQPYNEALTIIETKAADLLSVIDEPDETQEAQQITLARKQWLVYAQEQIRLRREHGDYNTVPNNLRGKQQMDGMRAMFGRLVDHQTQIRDIRFRGAERASKITLALVAGFGLGGGILLAFLSRKQFIVITENYDAALSRVSDLNQTLELRVTERTSDLEQRSAELQEANRELEAFSYSISHDLRAPMRHIAGFANLLEKSTTAQLDVGDKENLSTIHETARLAGRMVDDLLSFSRAGRAPMRSVPVDLNALLVDCRKELLPDMKNRQVEWKIDPLPVVAGDPAMLKLVLGNLLANAIKYTSKREVGVIEVGCSNVPPPADRRQPTSISGREQATCFVKDNGVGFNMDYSDKLFGVFQRLHRAEEFEGTGIGLANVKRIIGRLGGRVWANGKLGEGATFYFTVPLSRAVEA